MFLAQLLKMLNVNSMCYKVTILTGAFLGEANLKATLITPEQLNRTRSPDDMP
jgi:hypothetical protein